MRLTASLALLTCLLCGSCLGSPEDLQAATDALDNLYDPIDLIYRNDPSKISYAIKAITSNLYLAYHNQLKLTSDEAESFTTHSVNELQPFNLILKLLYAQSARTRTAFTSPGGPLIRMYSFAILSKMIETYGDKKRLVLYFVSPTAATQATFYQSVSFMLTQELGLEEGDLDDDPIDMEGPFVDAIETLEGQLYNFFQQFYYSYKSLGAFQKLLPGRINTMNAAMHNIFVLLDWIMITDDIFMDPVDDQGTTLANYIYHFENNRVIDIISTIADVGDPVDQDIANLVTYAKFLLYTYFIDDDDTPPPDASDVVHRLQPVAFELNSNIIFTITK